MQEHPPETGNGDPRDAPRPEPSVPPAGELLSRFGRDVQELVRLEIALARSEVRESIQDAKQGGILLGAALVPGLAAVLILPLAAVWAIGLALPLWAAALIVGGALLLVSGLLLAAGRRKLAEASHPPEQTIETLKEDREWIRDQMRSGDA